MVSSMEVHGELLTARDDVTYYCYSLGQALVNAVGLNTGGATQQKQTAQVIWKKLFRLDYKKPWGYWVRLAGKHLPRAAMASCDKYRKALACQGLPKGTVRTIEENMCKHVVLTEVVAWYAQDPTRMTGCYDRFSAMKVVPELPYCLQHHGIGESRQHQSVPSRSKERNDH